MKQFNMKVKVKGVQHEHTVTLDTSDTCNMVEAVDNWLRDLKKKAGVPDEGTLEATVLPEPDQNKTDTDKKKKKANRAGTKRKKA